MKAEQQKGWIRDEPLKKEASPMDEDAKKRL